MIFTEMDCESKKKKTTRINYCSRRCHTKKNQECQRAKLIQFVLCWIF